MKTQTAKATGVFLNKKCSDKETFITKIGDEMFSFKIHPCDDKCVILDFLVEVDLEQDMSIPVILGKYHLTDLKIIEVLI